MAELSWPVTGSDTALLPHRSDMPIGNARQDHTKRSAFLQSYQFAVKESFGDRLRRRLKEAKETGRAVVSEVRDRMFDRRSGARMFRDFHLKALGWKMHPFSCLSAKKLNAM